MYVAFRIVPISQKGSIALAFHVLIIFMTSFLFPFATFHLQMQGHVFSFGTFPKPCLQSSTSVGGKKAALFNLTPHTSSAGLMRISFITFYGSLFHFWLFIFSLSLLLWFHVATIQFLHSHRFLIFLTMYSEV